MARRTDPPPALAVVPERTVDIADAVETMSPSFLQCRDFGHSWRPWRTRYSDQERAYTSELRCSRCHTVRVRTISARGAIVGSHYEYAEGYQIHGLGMLSSHDRDTIRLASMVRLSAPRVARSAEAS